MPASGKMLRSRAQAANRAAGIGDEQGRLPNRVKATEVNAKCTFCGQEIRMTKRNVEAKSHWEQRHPSNTYAQCFPGQFDPTVAPPVEESSPDEAKPVAAAATSGGGGGGPARKKKEDLSFLDEAIAPKKK